ncbi:MAG: DEAD/DEAH box helicase [Treponema sp.]|nr:DEAD/DEAH box helicase [Treponema sp.]
MIPQTFHPVIRDWFTETYGSPTSVQAQAWPLIERGENVLALAPTGSGKTLTAFLSAISRFCADDPRKYQAEKLSVLYVSPLKALNEDIKRNLLDPLAAIKNRFEKEGLPFPPIRVETRSGDTPQSERRRFFIRPPSILALTPESLAILLLNPKGRQILCGVKYFIIDEIHAVLGNKRGSFLSCQIDRLALIAGDFQRISLSATVRNPQTAADFTGGTGRRVHIVAPAAEKKIDFSVEFPNIEDNDILSPNKNKNDLTNIEKYGSRYTPLIDYILNRIWEGATLLVFVESRRRSEKLCYFLNNEAAVFHARNGNPPGRDLKGAVAYPHHGSLAKELRRSVEQGLAEGRLPCVVATASLELGIDIGDIDEVVLAGSTGSVSQALQRIGRSGHSVGQTSKGRLFTFHGKDLLLAAALKGAVDERDIEEIYPIENPLDVLAQLILALCAEKTRKIEELYELIRKFYIFRSINYESFNRVLKMCAGQGQDSRLRDIKPRIWIDREEETAGALDGTLTLLYSSGGVIANRGLYSMRLADGTKIGELDEEFVWERSVGDCFDFGARGWRVVKIGSESVEVTPLDKRADFIPFWKADTQFRSKNLTERALSILDEFNRTGDINIHINREAGNSLIDFLDSQCRAQNSIPLPDNKNITVEILKGNEINRDFCSIVFHSFRGGQINYPLSLALSAELTDAINLRVETFSNDDNILFALPRLGLEDSSSPPEEIFRRALASLETTDSGGITRGERHFRNRLESSGIFGANFREAAERSLLLPKARFGKRTPLWIMRQRSKRLFDSVAQEDGFPVTAEAWRSCLTDTFDMDGFRDLLAAINSGAVALSFFHTVNPSPFSRDMVREETNSFMYEYDERKDLAGNSHIATLSDKVIEEAVANAALRPVLKAALVENFTSRLRRELPGWAPDDALSLGEWVKERIAIPEDEWKTLRGVMPETLTENIDSMKIKIVTRNGAAMPSVIHREWDETWNDEPLSILGQWLRYEGPVSVERICGVFGVNAAEAEDAVCALVEVEEAVRDVVVSKDAAKDSLQLSSLSPLLSALVCDRDNLEMLLRLSRKKERPVIKERPASLLIPFLALRQGLGKNGNETFKRNLYAWTAPAKLWETEILCARNSSYDPEKINREIREGKLVWYGSKGGKERIGFCRPEDLDLAYICEKGETDSIMEKLLTSSFFDRPRDFWEIKNELSSVSGGVAHNIDSRSCAEAIWREVWQGRLTSDSLDPVRKGIESGFIPKEIDIPQKQETTHPFGRRPRIPGALKNRWKSGAPVSGSWFSLVMDEKNAAFDPIEEDILNRDRVRLLLDRWGVLCRPLLEHEDAPFTWSSLLPAMRRMELAGELTAGRFFAGINSLQFASQSIAAELEQAENFSGIYWMNASDPASPAGLDVEGLGYTLCARSSNNRIYFKGAELIALSCKNCKELQIFTGADDPDMEQLTSLFKIPRTRTVLPENKLIVETINGQTAAQSGYAECFKNAGFVSDRGKLIFW